jgi:hypothetical protein
VEIPVQAVLVQVTPEVEADQVTPALEVEADLEPAVEAVQVTPALVQVVDPAVDQEHIYLTLVQKVSLVVLLENLDAMQEADIILMDIGILPFTMQMVMQ